MTMRIVQNLIRNCVDHSVEDVVVVFSTLENAVISFKNPVKDTGEIDVKRMGGFVTANLHECELRVQVELLLSR